MPNNTTICDYCSSYKQIKATRKHYKENVIAQLLEENKIDCVHNKIPEGSCNKYRPDFVIDCATHYIIVEVDEHQHSGYKCECEQGRMINIAQDVGGGLPVYFIRYNPDTYKTKKGDIGSTNILARHNKLIRTIELCQAHIPQRLITVSYLFYDGYDPVRPEVFELVIDANEL